MMLMLMGFGLIVPLLLIVVALALGWQPQFNQTRPAQTSQAPLEILNARYARGEITNEEYEQMRLDLEG